MLFIVRLQVLRIVNIKLEFRYVIGVLEQILNESFVNNVADRNIIQNHGL